MEDDNGAGSLPAGRQAAPLTSKGAIALAVRLFALYVAIIVVPLAVAAAAFALRDLLSSRKRGLHGGNGHAEIAGLEDTVEEVRAPS